MSEAVRLKLEKLANMAARAEGNERANAERLFDAALKRHGFKREDFLNPDEKKIETRIAVANDDERKLLLQIIAYVTDNTRPYLLTLSGGGRKRQWIEATPAHTAEIVFLYSIYRRAFRTEIDRLRSAFFHKHHLFPATPDDDRGDDRPPMPLEESLRLQKMVGSLQEVTVRKAIGSAN